MLLRGLVQVHVKVVLVMMMGRRRRRRRISLVGGQVGQRMRRRLGGLGRGRRLARRVRARRQRDQVAFRVMRIEVVMLLLLISYRVDVLTFVIVLLLFTTTVLDV